MNLLQYTVLPIINPLRPWLFIPRLLVLFTAICVLFLLPSGAVLAQDNDWVEQPTDHFIILFTPNHIDVASEYAGFVDVVYEETANAFNYSASNPITLRLYPTFEDYYEVNPLARNMPGVVAHADFRRREVAVILPQTERQTEEEIQNNVRHELTHIIAADLSGNRLNTGFQEGIAQYMEQHSPGLIQQKTQYLADSYQRGQLLSWSDFDDRDAVYSNPQISYPQTLSIISFLVERYGFDTLRNFLVISKNSSGYRSALERAYGVSPADLEEQWRDWLPSYIEGGYLNKSVGSYDLSYPRRLLEAGRYAEAEAELTSAIEWMVTNPEGDDVTAAPSEEMLTDAEAMLNQSQQGQQAEAQAHEARAALEQGQYELARQKIEQARASYAALNDTRQNDVLDSYAERVERGLWAIAQLERARSQKDALRFLDATAAADAAANEFAAIGDVENFNQAMELRRSLDTRQRIVGMGLLVFGIVGLVMSMVSRFFWRQPDIW